MTDDAADMLEPATLDHDYLADALAKAQGKFNKIERTKEVDVKGKEGRAGYKFKYAPLSSVMAAVQPALTANGLAITHRLARGLMFTRLKHVSGQYEESEFPVASNLPAQALGSLLTYGQRYNIKLLLNLAPDEEDDDGNDAAGHTVEIRTLPPRSSVLTHATDSIRTARKEIENGTASTVAQSPTVQRGVTAQAATPALEKRVKEWTTTSIQGFSLLPTAAAMREWWNDPSVMSRRETAKLHYRDEHQRLCEAYDLRLEELAAMAPR